MNKKFVVPFNLVLIAASLILLTISFVTVDSLASKLSAVCEIILLIIAVLYIAFDYSKEGAKYYKAFFIFYAASFLVETACFDLDYNGSALVLILLMIIYGNVLLLGFGKDLGKTTSYILSLFNVAIYALNLISFIIDGPVVFIDVIVYVSWVIDSLIAFIMVGEKYRDKQLRNTK